MSKQFMWHDNCPAMCSILSEDKIFEMPLDEDDVKNIMSLDIGDVLHLDTFYVERIEDDNGKKN